MSRENRKASVVLVADEGKGWLIIFRISWRTSFFFVMREGESRRFHFFFLNNN